MGGQDADVLTLERGASGHAAPYDAWFSTPLGSAMDAAEAPAVMGIVARGEVDRA